VKRTHGNLWVQLGGLGGIVEIDPRGLILGFVPIPNGDAATTNFAFGGPDNQYIYFEGAISGTFWRCSAAASSVPGRLAVSPWSAVCSSAAMIAPVSRSSACSGL
jgi:gluconolactonase